MQAQAMPTQATPTPTVFSPLHGHKYLSLATFHEGGIADTGAVWYAQDGDTLYVLLTSKDGEALYHIRNHPHVRVAPATGANSVLGPFVDGTARILSPDEAKTANKLLGRKYLLMKFLVDLIGRVAGNHAIIEITPR